MKKIILLIISVICLACSDSINDEIEKTGIEKEYEIADMFLEFDAEKVGLISIIKDLPQEKTNSVLRDYLAKTLGNSTSLSSGDPMYFVNIVDTIATENGLSKKMTASIIFSYQYEMITNDVIIEE